MSKSRFAIVVVAVLALGWLGWKMDVNLTANDQPTGQESIEPQVSTKTPNLDFPPSLQGKILVIYELVGDIETHWALRDLRFETISGRVFIVGTVLPTGEGEADWQRDLVIRIAWDSVKTLLEFENEAQYRERMLLEQEQKKET